MNLCEDRREQGVNVLSPQLIPVLILIKTWSEGSGDPSDNVDLVLLILEAVCALEGVQDEVSFRYHHPEYRLLSLSQEQNMILVQCIVGGDSAVSG